MHGAGRPLLVQPERPLGRLNPSRPAPPHTPPPPFVRAARVRAARHLPGPLLPGLLQPAARVARAAALPQGAIRARGRVGGTRQVAARLQGPPEGLVCHLCCNPCPWPATTHSPRPLGSPTQPQAAVWGPRAPVLATPPAPHSHPPLTLTPHPPGAARHVWLHRGQAGALVRGVTGAAVARADPGAQTLRRKAGARSWGWG